MEVIEISVPTGKSELDYPLRAGKTIEAIRVFDGFYVHLKGPDEPAHDGKAELKKEIIEAIDRYFFERLIPKVGLKDTIICVTADHSTPCPLKAHSDDPVPILICGGKIKSDKTSEFSESACQSGSLGILKGTEIMPRLIEYARF
jgi:2,3-bisphosphoglycerate-independent phosphoglycerate mutase